MEQKRQGLFILQLQDELRALNAGGSAALKVSYTEEEADWVREHLPFSTHRDLNKAINDPVKRKLLTKYIQNKTGAGVTWFRDFNQAMFQPWLRYVAYIHFAP